MVQIIQRSSPIILWTFSDVACEHGPFQNVGEPLLGSSLVTEEVSAFFVDWNDLEIPATFDGKIVYHHLVTLTLVLRRW